MLSLILTIYNVKRNNKVKITESQLRAIIKQELKNILAINEASLSPEQRAARAATRAKNKAESDAAMERMKQYFAQRETTPDSERTYFKQGTVEATKEEYDNSLYSGGGSVWQGEDGKYYKQAMVPATKKEYKSSQYSGNKSVQRDK